VIEKAFIASQALALVWLLWKRYRFPWFITALACWFAQAIFVTKGPQFGAPQPIIDHWLRTQWVFGEGLAVIATCGAVLEAIGRVRRYAGSPFLRMQLSASCTALPAALVGMGILFAAPVVGDGLASFRIIRSWSWVALALAMGITAFLTALQRVRMPRQVRFHLYLLLIVLGAHSVISWGVNASDAQRALARTIYRSTVIAACVGWCVNASYREIHAER